MLVLESQVLSLTFKVKLGQLTKCLNTQLPNFTFLVIWNRGILPAVDLVGDQALVGVSFYAVSVDMEFLLFFLFFFFSFVC